MKIIRNGRKDKIKRVKKIDELKYIKHTYQEICFNKELGYGPYKYLELPYLQLTNKLNVCGIKRGDNLYNVAMTNYNIYSRYGYNRR